MLTLSQLSVFFRQNHTRPRKSLGQNFLIDNNIKDKIIEHCRISNDDTALEIGPGLGALTEGLCRKAKFVYAVEKDVLFAKILKENLKSFKNLEIIREDILKLPFPIKHSALNIKLKVIGNLPYYITSPIMTYLIKNRKFIGSVYVTVQKELAERITAIPSSREYGAFTVYLNYYTRPSILFAIKKTCFYPRPEVDSCFLKIEILDKPPVETNDEKLFFNIVRSAFQKRRKTILNSLKQSKLGLPKEKLAIILEKAGIDPERRPETLSISDFARLVKSQ